MVRLRRQVRVCVPGDSSESIGADVARTPESGRNGHGGSPAMTGLGRWYAIEVDCTGEPDPTIGYLVDIKTIDRAVRTAAVPRILDAVARDPGAHPATLIGGMLAGIAAALPRTVAAVHWLLTPTYRLSVEANNMANVLIRQRFEFAASHRLHVSGLSDAENRSLFGKCNSPHGHGHNYEVEPCVETPASDGPLALGLLERITDEVLIQRFDHKHLNLDTQEFAQGSGVNPTVENIARVFHGLLAPAIERAAPGSRLRSITVWETPRTSATYPA